MGETNGPLSLADDREVENICRRFDIDLRAGRQPRLEDALADCREDLQQVVLRELLLTEIEFRLEINSLHADSLKQRFPDHVDLIDELLAEVTAGAETAPARIGRYDIVQEIGRGGMGRVFLANDTALHRQVALKIPRFEDPCFKGSAAPRSIERFYREARLMAGLRHKNLCPVYDVGQAGDTHYLTMAYIPGVSLAERFEHGVPWPVDKAVAVVERASRGLAVAHRAGVVHRDLKPSNIIFDNDGEPVVTDFGLARSAVDSSEWSHPELRIGTPKYMSPEQIDSPWTVGPATDVYALGVLLYQLITGRMPFESTSAVRVMLQIVSASNVPPLSRHVPEIDRRLETICLKAMARDPADRYPNAGELADALAGWQRSCAAQTAALPQRRRSRTAALLAALLLAAAASVILIRPWNDERRQAWRIDRGGLPDNGTAPMPSRRSPQAAPEKLPPLAATGWTVDHERTTKIASAVGGGPLLTDYYRFGDAIASLGDLDGDGNHDFAVGAWRDQTGGPGRGAVHVLFMNDDGTARQVCSITGASTGGPELVDFERFGCSLAAVGDLDGDGVTELAVGAKGSEDNSELPGSVYVLFLNRDATLKKTVQISSDIGGGPPLSAFDTFGAAVAVIDFADDRFPKLAVGCTGDDTGFGDAGAVYLLALDSDGTCANWRKIAAGDAGLPLAEADRFGSAITAVGDLDGDGIEEMTAGAPGDDTSGPDRGAVYLLFPKADGNIARFQKITCGTVVERNSFRSESTETGFSLSDGAGFGSALAAVTSRADDTVDLVIGAPFEHDSGDQRGAVFLLSISADGSVSRAAKIGSGTPGAPSLRDFDNFGSAIARQGTATGGAIHLLIGASGDDTGGSDRGAVYSLFAMPDTDQP